MPDAFGTTPVRDRWVVAVVLALMTVLAWAYLIRLGADAEMADMPGMPGMSMADMAGPYIKAWTPTEFILTFAMWAVMMVGMMTPSAAPMILIYTRVARQAALQGKPLAAAGYFAGGYLASWTAFSLLATGVQWGLERAALLTAMASSASRPFGGIVLIAAGAYQWTPLKYACLQQCQSPLAFIQNHGGFKRSALGSWRLGLLHGAYCIGCCWALMALLFVGGVMNLVWIAAIAVLVLIEKVVPSGHVLARVAGVGFVAAGLWFIAT